MLNVLLHVLATGLVVRVARTVLPPGSGNIGPAVAGLLFASHPIHTEAVAGIVGRADLAACNFYLLSFLIYVLHIKYRDNICFKTIKINHSSGVSGGMNTSSLSSNHHCLCLNQVTNVTTPNDFCCMKHNLMLSALSTFVTNNNNNNNNHRSPHYLRQHNNSMRVNNNLFKIDNCEDSLRTHYHHHYHHHHLWYGEYDNNLLSSTTASNHNNNNNNNNENTRNRLWCKCNNKQGTVCTMRVVKQWVAFITCVLCATAAVLSKETGISVLAVCALYDFIHSPVKVNQKKQLRSMMLLGLSLFVLLGLRMHMASGITPTFATADNPAAKSTSVYTRFLTFSYLPTFNFNLLLCPSTLSFDWSMDAIPRINSIFDSRNLMTLIFYTIFYKIIKIAFQKIRKQQIDYSNRKVQQQQYSNNKYRRKTNNSEIFIDKYLPVCQCPVCHHNITDHHSQTCRTNNNNNSVPSSHTMCICKTSLASSSSNHIFPLLSSSKPTVIIREQQQYTSTSSTSSTTSSSKDTKVKNPYVTILMACAFLALPFLPATNIFFYVGFVVAERVLYLPSVGYCLLVGLAMSRVWRVKKYWRYTCACLTVLMILFCARTIRRNLDWRDEESLYRSAITVNPPKAYGNLGSVLSSQGRIAEAEWAYNKALEYRTNMADVHYNLGILLQGRKQYDAAIRSYQRAIHFRPSLALAYVNLGSALVAAGRCQEAVAILRQGSKLDGTGLKDRRTHETARVSALLQLGSLYADQGRLQRALAAYREALHTMPDHYPPQSVYNLLGETLTRLHQFEEAERWYQAALQVQPDHVPAHITYGKLLAKNVSNHSSRVVEAEQWFRRAQRLAPDDPSVYHHYGEFLASLQRHNEAAVQYTRAAELKPADYELVVAAATALRQADRRIDAEYWYRKAVQLRPLDARGHTNLGAILHLNGKYSEAAASYREALRLQPDDVTTLTNLHKLYSLMA
ncbi:protein O-mannosyl-transferase TMTC2-like [Chrysoperla carnea]|uniref:protein O-mannosyl-transferase TMTC2-like n=1 Tax=Chrysoperla carnea TaxID=189513 RepID=UPI001D08FE20|nr:protein O-mannosyl-transferase TMTC2-like [Chrysoperla carnea]